ncbi:MAG: type III-B CRISPR module-associated protein Cmr3 [Candidatus Sericytochromatia bacterium]|nr:type III-B CRISPR module-associated protein Cmr3 [Candidatus Sericytochromatia bacterium]
MKRIGLRIEALDTLFFRDGRPFVASSRAESGLPTPQTLTGALRSWLLKRADCDFDLLRQDLKNGMPFAEALAEQELETIAQLRVQGPWLASFQNDEVNNLFLAVPAALKRVKKKQAIERLIPRKSLPGWSASEYWPLWLSKRVELEGLSGYLNLRGMQTFLQGQTPDSEDICTAEDLYTFEARTGIGMDTERKSNEEGLIYAVNLLRLKTGIGFYAELSLPTALESTLPKTDWVMPLGGEGRRVIVSITKPVTWPKAEPKGNQLQTQVLISPTLLETPQQVKSWQARSAAMHPIQGVSGWDLALGGPKPLRWMLPAGSVLYFESHASLPELSSEDASDLGWGTYLKGVSDYV